MSNPVFYAEPADLAGLGAGDNYVLTGAEARHAVSVKRLEAGEAVEISDGRGLRLVCRVEAAHQGELHVSVVERSVEQRSDSELVLVQALAKGDRDELAIEMATELGVDSVFPWQAERSIVRWKMDKASKGVIKWRNVVAAAAKQARRTRVPLVGELLGTASLTSLIEESSLTLLLHEDATESIPAILVQIKADSLALDANTGGTFRQIVMIVGPEGGISEKEIAAFTQAGARMTILGPHVLRSSTAGPAAVVLLSQELGRW